MSDLIERLTNIKDELLHVWLADDEAFTIQQAIEKLKVMEKLAKEPQGCDSDCISRKKLIEEIKTNKLLSRECATVRIMEYINNQQQVQPTISILEIVRTPEEIAMKKCCIYCGLKNHCYALDGNPDCDEYIEFMGWLTGKEV